MKGITFEKKGTIKTIPFQSVCSFWSQNKKVQEQNKVNIIYGVCIELFSGRIEEFSCFSTEQRNTILESLKQQKELSVSVRN